MDEAQREAVDSVAYSAYAFYKYRADEQLRPDGTDPNGQSVETILAAAAKTPLGLRLVEFIDTAANELTGWTQSAD